MCNVQVAIYRTGPSYGDWNFSHSPEGHKVHIKHYLPTSYGDDGHFDTATLHKSWTFAADKWRQDPFRYLKYFVGKKIAAEVNPLFQLPPEVAPDARLG